MVIIVGLGYRSHAEGVQPRCSTALLKPYSAILNELARLRLEINQAKKTGSLALAHALSVEYVHKLHEAGLTEADFQTLKAELNIAKQDQHSVTDKFNVVKTAENERRQLPFRHVYDFRQSETLTEGEFSPDGRLVVTASNDNTSILWDAVSGKPLHTLSGHTARPSTATFSPDGKRLVTAAYDAKAIVWDTATGEKLMTLTGHEFMLANAVFSPDGNYLATSAFDRYVLVWDLTTGKPIHKLDIKDRSMPPISFTPNGKNLITVGYDHALIWNLASEKIVHELPATQGTKFRPSFSSDGKLVALLGLPNKSASIWHVETGVRSYEIKPSDGTINAVLFSPDGNLVAGVTTLGETIVVDATTGAVKARLKNANNILKSFCFSADSSQIITAATDATVTIWDLTAASSAALPVFSFKTGQGDLLKVFVSKDGDRVLSVSDDKASIWERLDHEVP